MEKTICNYFKLQIDTEHVRYSVNNQCVNAFLTAKLIVPKFERDGIEYKFGFNTPCKFKAVGKAKVMDGDTYSLDTGRKISLAKAEVKLYRSAVRAIQKEIEHYESFFQAFEEFDEKAFEVINHNNQYIKEIG